MKRRYKKCIQWVINWHLPDKSEPLTSVYVLEVPEGVTPSFYLWLCDIHRTNYKRDCFIKRLKSFP